MKEETLYMFLNLYSRDPSACVCVCGGDGVVSVVLGHSVKWLALG